MITSGDIQRGKPDPEPYLKQTVGSDFLERIGSRRRRAGGNPGMGSLRVRV